MMKLSLAAFICTKGDCNGPSPLPPPVDRTAGAVLNWHKMSANWAPAGRPTVEQNTETVMNVATIY